MELVLYVGSCVCRSLASLKRIQLPQLKLPVLINVLSSVVAKQNLGHFFPQSEGRAFSSSALKSRITLCTARYGPEIPACFAPNGDN